MKKKPVIQYTKDEIAGIDSFINSAMVHMANAMNFLNVAQAAMKKRAVINLPPKRKGKPK